jgi:hypothetical protein
MLTNPTIAKLTELGLSAMAAGLADQLDHPGGPWAGLDFTDRLGLLVEAEADARDTRRVATRLKAAKLRYPSAVPEDIDWHTPPGPGPARRRLPRHRRMGGRRPQPDPHRPDRRRQELAGLRPRPRGDPRRTHRRVPAHPTPARRAAPRPGRRPLRPHPRHHRPTRPAGPRRLPPHPRRRRGLPGPARSARRTRRAPIGGDHQPAPPDTWLAAMADPTLAEAVTDRALHAAHRVTLKGASMRRRQPPT